MVVQEESYPRDRPILGKVEIINNLHHQQKSTHNDVVQIKHALRWIGMIVSRPKLSLNVEETKSVLDEILDPKTNLSEYNLFCLVIICHGADGQNLLAADGQVSVTINQILEKFENLEDMKGRPKLLIIDGVKRKENEIGLDFLCNENSPNNADTIIAYSTVPSLVMEGQPSGSPFLLSLANEIKKYSSTKSLQEILQFVSRISSLTNIITGKIYAIIPNLKKIKLFLEEKHSNTSTNESQRFFGDPNGWGHICEENLDYISGNFKNGQLAFTGKCIFEFSKLGLIRELEFNPESSDWDNFTANITEYNIEETWRYEGQCKNEEWHGSGILWRNDGTIFIGNFEKDKFHGPGCLFSNQLEMIDYGIWSSGTIHKSYLNQQPLKSVPIPIKANNVKKADGIQTEAKTELLHSLLVGDVERSDKAIQVETSSSILLHPSSNDSNNQLIDEYNLTTEEQKESNPILLKDDNEATTLPNKQTKNESEEISGVQNQILLDEIQPQIDALNWTVFKALAFGIFIGVFIKHVIDGWF